MGVGLARRRSGCCFGCSAGTLSSMSEREVYPNAPIVLAAMELRHPLCVPLSPGAQVTIGKLLAAELPVPMMANLVNLQASVGSAPTMTTELAPRYVSRDRSTAITFKANAVVIETSRYERWERLRALAKLAFEARQAVDAAVGVERFGLRYIDEVRVPGSDQTQDWGSWVNQTLLGPAAAGVAVGLTTVEWQGIAVYDNGPDRTLVLRYGPREGYAVDPAGELKRAAPPPGPYFLLDIDSFWTPSGDIPEVDIDSLLVIADDLHAPVRMLFEGLITERLRKEVLRNG